MVTNAEIQIKNINATLIGLKDKGVSKEEETKVKYYEELLKVLGPKLDKAKEEFNTMTKGNTLEYIKNN